MNQADTDTTRHRFTYRLQIYCIVYSYSRGKSNHFYMVLSPAPRRLTFIVIGSPCDICTKNPFQSAHTLGNPWHGWLCCDECADAAQALVASWSLTVQQVTDRITGILTVHRSDGTIEKGWFQKGVAVWSEAANDYIVPVYSADKTLQKGLPLKDLIQWAQ